jgi:hypothetical protein
MLANIAKFWQIRQSYEHLPNFGGLVLGGIEADSCQ